MQSIMIYIQHTYYLDIEEFRELQQMFAHSSLVIFSTVNFFYTNQHCL